jgi:hypothetical protein
MVAALMASPVVAADPDIAITDEYCQHHDGWIDAWDWDSVGVEITGTSTEGSVWVECFTQDIDTGEWRQFRTTSITAEWLADGYWVGFPASTSSTIVGHQPVYAVRVDLYHYTNATKGEFIESEFELVGH